VANSPYGENAFASVCDCGLNELKTVSKGLTERKRVHSKKVPKKWAGARSLQACAFFTMPAYQKINAGSIRYQASAIKLRTAYLTTSATE
jgi:hypothetical protein